VGFLGTEVNFDSLIATCLLLQREIERVELEIELAMAVADLVLVQKLRPRQHPNGWEHCQSPFALR
jgi:hypothetical protein